jgi:hypothetical protein
MMCHHTNFLARVISTKQQAVFEILQMFYITVFPICTMICPYKFEETMPYLDIKALPQ